MGADSFAGLRRWHRAAEIPFVAPLIVASRPGEVSERSGGTLPAGLTLRVRALARSISQVESAEKEQIELRRYILRNSAGERPPSTCSPASKSRSAPRRSASRCGVESRRGRKPAIAGTRAASQSRFGLHPRPRPLSLTCPAWLRGYDEARRAIATNDDSKQSSKPAFSFRPPPRSVKTRRA